MQDIRNALKFCSYKVTGIDDLEDVGINEKLKILK